MAIAADHEILAINTVQDARAWAAIQREAWDAVDVQLGESLSSDCWRTSSLRPLDRALQERVCPHRAMVLRQMRTT